MDFAELEGRLKLAHPGNDHRERIWRRYKALLSHVQGTGLPFEVWIANGHYERQAGRGLVGRVFGGAPLEGYGLPTASTVSTPAS